MYDVCLIAAAAGKATDCEPKHAHAALTLLAMAADGDVLFDKAAQIVKLTLDKKPVCHTRPFLLGAPNSVLTVIAA